MGYTGDQNLTENSISPWDTQVIKV